MLGMHLFILFLGTNVALFRIHYIYFSHTDSAVFCQGPPYLEIERHERSSENIANNIL